MSATNHLFEVNYMTPTKIKLHKVTNQVSPKWQLQSETLISLKFVAVADVFFFTDILI